MLSKKKWIVLICAAALTLSACTACGGSASSGGGNNTSSTAQASKTPAQISKEVMDSGIEFPEMIEVNADNLKLQYSLEDGDFQELGGSGVSQNCAGDHGNPVGRFRRFSGF